MGNDFGQISHLYGVNFVWVYECLIKCALFEKTFPHVSHILRVLACLFPKCMLKMCAFKDDWLKKNKILRKDICFCWQRMNYKNNLL